MRSTRCAVIAAALLALAPSLAAAQGSQRFTVEEMLKLDRVADPQISFSRRPPRGLRRDPGQPRATAGTATCARRCGGTPIAVARSARSDDTPRWSPEGRTLAFVSTREGSSQVWLVGIGAAGRPASRAS